MAEKLAFYLDDIQTRAGKWINLILTSLVLLSSVIFVIETYPIPGELTLILARVNTAILIVFFVEYIIRFWAAEQKINYLFSLYSIIDLIVILPLFIGNFEISYLRLLRWFRILRLLRFVESQVFFDRTEGEDQLIIRRIIFTLFTIVFVYSGLIYQVEHPTNPQAFRTFIDAVYFCVVTMTTVGFGDVTPLSQGGRLLTILMIISGIALIPGQLGALIKELVRNANRVETPCGGCGLSRHDRDAQFCKVCGTLLNSSPLNPSRSPDGES
ncbi:ion transporter [Laspinema sp. A4]|uniref:ion transporter n=1 Tax=Laspinema sp. D2d TaxID=2953686 RepID=UPI0021BB6F36|nr:ion transporter [Laspinema sp. D2d]MCT7985963.1 ion transporter [Laspinema sp. D2d]